MGDNTDVIGGDKMKKIEVKCPYEDKCTDERCGQCANNEIRSYFRPIDQYIYVYPYPSIIYPYPTIAWSSDSVGTMTTTSYYKAV